MTILVRFGGKFLRYGQVFIRWAGDLFGLTDDNGNFLTDDDGNILTPD